MRKLMVLGAVLAAVAPRRRILARVGLAAAVAVSLLWIGGHGAQAGSFNLTTTWSVSNTVADSPSEITTEFEWPEGDVFFSLAVSFWPTGWQITPSSEVAIGVQRGTLDMVFQVGVFNSPCNTQIPIHWDTMNATTDKSQTVTYEDGFDDSNGDGNIDFIDMYPDFNDRILGPAEPIMREANIADLPGGAGKMLGQFLYYEPGATIAGRTLDPALGYPIVAVIGNVGDPEAVPKPSAATDTCTPLPGTWVELGTAEDGTILSKTPKQAGTYTFSGLSVGQRDADGDGYENNLDPCPLTADADWDPRAASAVGPGDADGDGLPSSCDPDDNGAKADQDGDGYSNREDNCPLVANGVAAGGNQKDGDFDGIGDACDPNRNNADTEGEAPESSASQEVTITAAAATPPAATPTSPAAAATPSPTAKATPPAATPTPPAAAATPSPTAKATPPAATPTPPPAKSPTPTPAVKTATPTVVAPSAGGGGFASDSSRPWWPLAIAGAAVGAVGALLAWQAKAGARR